MVKRKIPERKPAGKRILGKERIVKDVLRDWRKERGELKGKKRGEVLKESAKKLPEKYRNLILLSLRKEPFTKLDKLMREWDMALQDIYDSFVDQFISEKRRKGFSRLIKGDDAKPEIRKRDSKVVQDSKRAFGVRKLETLSAKMEEHMTNIKNQIGILEECLEQLGSQTDANGYSIYGIKTIALENLSEHIEVTIDILKQKKEDLITKTDRVRQILQGK